MRTALITGASGEIGAAIAEEFHRCGYRVALQGAGHFANAAALADRLNQQAGGSAAAVQGDLSEDEGCRRVFTQALAFLGHLDVLVNCAGISMIHFFDAMTPEEWNRMVQVNLSSAVFLSQCACREMLRQKSGSIVNVSSVWGISGAAMEVAYSTVKAGMLGLTRSLALELAPSGITVNAVAPGYIDTQMNGHLSPEEQQALCAEIPLQRAGTPAEVAAAVRFLAESPYITGEVLPVTGGWR